MAGPEERMGRWGKEGACRNLKIREHGKERRALVKGAEGKAGERCWTEAQEMQGVGPGGR